MRSTLVFDIDFGLLPAVACLTLKIVFDDFNFIAYMFSSRYLWRKAEKVRLS